jgi:HAD superfamily hydrolase (TIGR01509 family)
MNIIIPIGGKGERFKKEGYTHHKPLIPIFDKTMIEYVIDNIKYTSEDYLFIIYNEKLNTQNFRKHINLKYPEISLIEINKDTRGATETLIVGMDIIFSQYKYHNKTLIIDCDTFYTYDIVTHARNLEDNGIFYRYSDNINPIYSYISLNDDTKKIIDIKEKIKISNNANTGAYVFTNIHTFYSIGKQIIETPEKWYNNEPYISCVIQQMLNEGATFVGLEINNKNVFSLGTPKELEYYKNNIFAFLFDLDGTLVITDDIYFLVWEKILKRYNLILTNDIFKKYIQGNNDKYVINTLLNGVILSLTELSKQKDELFITFIQKMKFIKGATEMIKTIHDLGHKCCIVTNCNRIVANEIIQKMGITSDIDFIITAEDCINGKPSPEPYMTAINKYNIHNNRCIIFEDSKSGILSAKSVSPLLLVGIETIYTKTELYKHGISKTLKNYIGFDINDYIDSIQDYKYKKIKDYIFDNYTKKNTNEIIKDIIINDNKLKGGFIADIISMEIKTNLCDYNVIFKYEVLDITGLSIMAKQLDLYEREYYFYEYISPYINIKIPRFYSIVKNDNDKNMGIILDNLFKKNGRYNINVNLNREKIDVSLKIIDNMVKLHTQFWNKDLQNSFPNLKKTTDSIFKPFMNDYIQEKNNIFKEKWKGILSEEDFIIYNVLLNNFEKNQANLSNGSNLTLIHGDIKSPNIFYDITNDYEPCFIDWQHSIIGKGTQDLIFFILESFDIETLYIYFPLFKNYYYKKLLENGITNYRFSEYENDIKESIGYIPFFTSIWFGSLSEDELIDKNFPFFFIQKLFYLCKKFIFIQE